MCRQCYMAAYDDRPEARARQAIRRDRSETKAYHAAYRANNKDAIKAYKVGRDRVW